MVHPADLLAPVKDTQCHVNVCANGVGKAKNEYVTLQHHLAVTVVREATTIVYNTLLGSDMPVPCRHMLHCMYLWHSRWFGRG